MLEIHSEKFWDKDFLIQEMRRVFDVCHGCRLCLKLCPVFPNLFELIDNVEGDIRSIDFMKFMQALVLCFQCKRCYVKCPYIPPHPYQLDFPKLVLRARAVIAKHDGITFQDKLLTRSEWFKKFACFTAPVSNWLISTHINRVVLEKGLGIHREKFLGKFHHQTFIKWWNKRIKEYDIVVDPVDKVALFYTCYVNYNAPDIGQSAVLVLERNKVDILCPTQCCCGSQSIEVGDIETALIQMETNLKSFGPLAKEGYTIVGLCPSCTYLLKYGYTLLSGGREDAKLVAQKTKDICEYLMELEKQGKLDKDFLKGLGNVSYHMPCHLKAQNIGYRTQELLQLIPNTTVDLVERCSGNHGIWALKKDHYHYTKEISQPLIQKLEEIKPNCVVTDCPMAAQQIEEESNIITPIHPMQAVAYCYGIEDLDVLNM